MTTTTVADIVIYYDSYKAIYRDGGIDGEDNDNDVNGDDDDNEDGGDDNYYSSDGDDDDTFDNEDDSNERSEININNSRLIS